MFGLSELAIILIVVILVLGAKKLPDLARSAGKSARILKAEARAMKEEQAAHEQTTHADQADRTAPRVLQGEIIPPGSSATTDTGQSAAPRTPAQGTEHSRPQA
ncbi:Sec-independent protein translocase subunit TatA [Streptomyces bluensis]|uniref:Sec-independent protein translocase subunit TatA n=1 Tax=Streptomyces bluensis TaxID=33897 RepID=UPI001678238F|nr:Sec-independent protein translocase subunit TatA [Streptomyces bluensis]GGZ82411.1 translocase [Streptomyces bluensis]